MSLSRRSLAVAALLLGAASVVDGQAAKAKTKAKARLTPPVGDKPHHYHITVFALKTEKLDVPGNATAAYIGFNLNANKLATARVTGLYGR